MPLANKIHMLKTERGEGAVKLIFLSLCTMLLSACAHNSDIALSESEAELENVKPAQQISQISLNSRSTADVDQIGVASRDYRTKQVLKNTDIPQLTVDQLIAYADRCAPNQQSKRSDIDCSELSLRVRRVFKTEDRVAEALITLNRLGRNQISETAEDQLARNSRNLSVSAQAIASGTFEAGQPLPTDQPIVSDALENFLNDIGLGVNAGAIVQSGGG